MTLKHKVYADIRACSLRIGRHRQIGHKDSIFLIFLLIYLRRHSISGTSLHCRLTASLRQPAAARPLSLAGCCYGLNRK